MQIIHPNLIQSEISEWKKNYSLKMLFGAFKGTYLSDISQWQNHV